MRAIRQAAFVALLFTLPAMFDARPCAQAVCRDALLVIDNSFSITAASPTETGRIVRDGSPSLCGRKTGYSLFDANVRHYTQVGQITTVGNLCARVDVDAGSCLGETFINVAAYQGFDAAHPELHLLGDSGSSPNPTGSFQFPLSGATAQIIASENTSGAGCASFHVTVSTQACRQPGFDVGGDQRADVTVYRPANGGWYTSDSVTGTFTGIPFGLASDVPTPGAYTGDTQRLANQSVFRPGSPSVFYYRPVGGGLGAQPWGAVGDIPVTPDFNGDGRVDFTVFRPSSGVWYSLLNGPSTFVSQAWGTNGDTPFAGDFDGDLKTDYGVARVSGGNLHWYIQRSTDGAMISVPFGLSGDTPVAADYDGDFKTDIAVWRPSTGVWYVLSSLTGAFSSFAFGVSTDVPQPADHDGDGKVDFVVFRESATPGLTAFYSWLSKTQTLRVEPWGQLADRPVLSQNRLP